jgi:thioredoxin-related protein
MYRGTIVTLIAFLIVITGNAQDQGIKFEKGLSWEQVKAKAKLENKFIFMDCYATWCGPCKWMNQNVFSKKEVGDYMNTKFISVAVQMDRTSKDALNEKRWYKDVKLIDNNYSISSVPTYLFFAPDGHIVHRVIGTTGKEIDAFIEKTKEALDTSRQYYTLIKAYERHLNDSVFLLKELHKSIEAKDITNVTLIGDAYFNSIENVYAKENIEIIEQSLKSTKSKTFNFFYRNSLKIDSIMGVDGYVERTIDPIILNEELNPLFEKDMSIDIQKFKNKLQTKYPILKKSLIERTQARFRNNLLRHEIIDPYYPQGTPAIDWELLMKKISMKYPGFDSKELLSEYKEKYYSYKKLWPQFEESMFSYINEYKHKFLESDDNSVAWDIFLYAKDPKLISEGIKLMEKNIIGNPLAEAEDIDTYANLLYKLGNKKDAIYWQKKAVELSKEYGEGRVIKEESLARLKKMEMNEITWQDNL